MRKHNLIWGSIDGDRTTPWSPLNTRGTLQGYFLSDQYHVCAAAPARESFILPFRYSGLWRVLAESHPGIFEGVFAEQGFLANRRWFEASKRTNA
jgi:hypothetical protein